MPRFKYLGGDQRPDLFGVLAVGDVVELAKKPDWGEWESTSAKPERAPTPQPAYTPAGPEVDQPDPVEKASSVAADEPPKEA